MFADIDNLLKEALVNASKGIDLDLAGKTVNDCLEAMSKMAETLKASDYSKKEYDRIAKALAHVVKAMDETFRMVQFAKGMADSRPDLGGGWMKALTDEQLDQVAKWLEESAREEERIDEKISGKRGESETGD